MRHLALLAMISALAACGGGSGSGAGVVAGQAAPLAMTDTQGVAASQMALGSASEPNEVVALSTGVQNAEDRRTAAGIATGTRTHDETDLARLVAAFEAAVEGASIDFERVGAAGRSREDERTIAELRATLNRLGSEIPRLRDMEARAGRVPPGAAAAIRATLRRRIDDLSQVLVQAVDRIPHLGFGFGIAPRAVEAFGVRAETDLGTPSCTDKDVENGKSYCQPGPWLSTRSPNFVKIKRTVYWRGDSQLPSGGQMSSSFVAQRAATRVAIHFSAEVYVEDDAPGLNRRMFVRAVVDGNPIDPTDVVFARGAERTTRSMIFTTNVGAGVHTVQMEWLADEGSTAYMRNASLLVRTGPRLSTNGSLTVSSAPGGVVPPSTTAGGFGNIPDMSGWIYVPPNGVLTASIAGEVAVSGDPIRAMVVRATVDGVPAAPSDVVFKRGSRTQSHAFTFGTFSVAPGWRLVRFQWLVESGGVAVIADRSLALAAYPSTGGNSRHPFVAPTSSGPNISTSSDTFAPVPNLGTTVHVSGRGNGEIAAIVSAEVFATGGGQAVLALAVDGEIVGERTLYTDGQEPGQAKAFTFDAKRLAPGAHSVAVHWKTMGGGAAGMGDRTLAVMSETGFIPDMAEPLPLQPGRITDTDDDGVTFTKGDNVFGMEPVIGGHDVLVLLWDPHREGEIDQTDLPAAAVTAQVFGATNSVDDYFRKSSGGRFWLNNAGVVGWFDSTIGNDLDTPLPFCINGYRNRHIAKRADAIRQADDAGFDFAAHDRNGDGFLEWQELAILLVIPQTDDFGIARGTVNDPDCDVEPLEVDGVRIPDLAEWYTNAQGTDFFVAAHELAHQIFLLDDIYQTGAGAEQARDVVGAWRFSLMSARAEQSGGAGTMAPQLSAVNKLSLGWVTPVTVHAGGVYALQDVKASDLALVLPRYNNEQRDDEYYVLENRQQNVPGLYDTDIGDSGVAIWHVVSDVKDNGNTPRGVPADKWVPQVGEKDAVPGIIDTQGRRAIRLLRRFDGYDSATNTAVTDVDNGLWQFGVGLLSGPCDSVFPDNVAAWADCTPSGYDISVLSLPAATMQVEITID